MHPSLLLDLDGKVIPMNMQLITTEQLVKELLSRCDHGALILMRYGESGSRAAVYIRNWTGNPHTAMGLCDDLRDHILAQSRSKEQPWAGEGT